LGGAYKTVVQSVQVLQNRLMKQMTFFCRGSSSNSIF